MMLSKADFEQLFPESFAPNHVNDTKIVVSKPSAACIARWEDDGGAASDAAASAGAFARTPTGMAIATNAIRAAMF